MKQGPRKPVGPLVFKLMDFEGKYSFVALRFKGPLCWTLSGWADNTESNLLEDEENG